MKIGRVFADLLTPLGTASSIEDGLALTLRRLIALTGAGAGAVVFRAPRGPAIVVVRRPRGSAARASWFAAVVERTARAVRVKSRVVGADGIADTPSEDASATNGAIRTTGGPVRGVLGAGLTRVSPPGTRPDADLALLAVPLGRRRAPVGALLLLGRRRRLGRPPLPTGFVRELGATIAQVWRVHRRALEITALNEILALSASSDSLDDVFRGFVEGLTRLASFDAVSVSLLDAERGDAEVIDVLARTVQGVPRRDTRISLQRTLLGEVVRSGEPIRIDDIADPAVPDASRMMLLAGGYRAALLVPLIARGGVLGAVVLASHRPAAFDATDVAVLSELARPLASSVEQRRLVDESRRRADDSARSERRTRALLAAGRAVSESLDLERTMSVILNQARAVLGADSCGLSTLDPATDELVTIKSLDLPVELVTRIRLKVGEGIAGLAVQELRPIQSRDLYGDPRAGYPQLARASGFRSILVAPLVVGGRAIGALSVLRYDVHEFSRAEEELLVALAEQAAIALEHARLYEHLEAMVDERTRELDGEKRFVEVVLETLPLGVFVLDTELRVVRVNREGARVLPDARVGGAFAALLGERAESVDAFVREVWTTRTVRRLEEDVPLAGGTSVVRVTAAPLDAPSAAAVVLVEDVTLAKRLEQQMLLTERLTTAGRLAAGVAHELNNPLATIAGCAEALRARLREHGLESSSELADFPHDLELIEEEAYRCKEITGSLLQFVRDPGSRKAPADLNAVVARSLELVAHQSRFAKSHIDTVLEPGLDEVTINEGQLRQVFLGLAANALEAMDGKGTLIVRTRATGGEVEVDFEDQGPGIPEGILGRIFDPFFTTKPPGQGTGLGLAIAQGIVNDHGGRIDVTSRPGQGSIFRVVLPR
jgi:signal transduction histidine kinase